jgi:hypothetical protein
VRSIGAAGNSGPLQEVHILEFIIYWDLGVLVVRAAEKAA